MQSNEKDLKDYEKIPPQERRIFKMCPAPKMWLCSSVGNSDRIVSWRLEIKSLNFSRASLLHLLNKQLTCADNCYT